MVLIKVSDKDTTLIDIPCTLSRWIRRIYCKYQKFFFLQVLADHALGLRYDGTCLDIICHNMPPYYLPLHVKESNIETQKLLDLLFKKYVIICKTDDHQF